MTDFSDEMEKFHLLLFLPNFDQINGCIFLRLFVVMTRVCFPGIFGLCGNVLTMIVLSHMETSKSFNKLLIALSFLDSLLIVNVIGETAIIGTFMGESPFWYKMSYPYILHPWKGIIQTGTIFMVVAVSAERYKAVCHPLR